MNYTSIAHQLPPADDEIAQVIEDALHPPKLGALLLNSRTGPAGAHWQFYRTQAGGPLPEYVVVSAADVFYSGPETYIFEADAEGEVTNWSELEGSFKGDLDHVQALWEAGYRVVTEEQFKREAPGT